MFFPIAQTVRDLMARWWDSLADSVDHLLQRFSPPEGQPPARLLRAEASAVNTVLDLYEAILRRILVIAAATRGPAPQGAAAPRLLFRIDELPPAPALRRETADPDFHLRPPPERALRAPRQPSDGLVPADRILRRLAALADLFNRMEVYIDAMRARLYRGLPPLRTALPDIFRLSSLNDTQSANLQDLHAAATEAQAFNSS